MGGGDVRETIFDFSQIFRDEIVQNKKGCRWLAS